MWDKAEDEKHQSERAVFFAAYEQSKSRLQREALDPAEYERRLREIIHALGI